MTIVFANAGAQTDTLYVYPKIIGERKPVVWAGSERIILTAVRDRGTQYEWSVGQHLAGTSRGQKMGIATFTDWVARADLSIGGYLPVALQILLPESIE